ncbi:MAG TPA: ATP-binding protein [Brevundimonas sp.]|uniref:sensor histidine kinase n=1 Tax=Brevundimonas sp. TaxID=1871086 RepID=UPI00260D77A6|nr:ATP-binding protein [Brevundimonas sp.]HRO34146.1 ATP-binding protein [Brevundimonas sp.]
MPYEISPSPVAPSAGSRLWTAGASGGVAVAVLVLAAALDHGSAPLLLAGAVVAGLATWLINRRPARSMAVATAETPLPAAETVDDEKALLNAAFEAVADPILIIGGGEADDIAGRRVLMANAAAREVLRLQPRGGLLLSAMRDPSVLEAVDEALYGGMTRVTDYTPGGARDRRWRAFSRPLPVGGETQAMALLVLRDETDARRMEMMRVDFLANASHELRTPLASLSGFIETLKGHARHDDAAREKFLDIMSAQAERMGRLVADLLSLSRIELNEHIPPSGRVDLARAAADVVDAVALLARERGVEMRLAGESAGVTVVGDRDEIIQVIQNLVDNAVKYSPPGAVVELTIQRDLTEDVLAADRPDGFSRLPLVTPDREGQASYAAVTVRDHGPGMARETLPRLTERFYRIEGQKSGPKEGTGLGLAIVKHIVNRHLGGLAVASAPGQGTAFTAWFPMVRAADATDASPPTT